VIFILFYSVDTASYQEVLLKKPGNVDDIKLRDVVPESNAQDLMTLKIPVTKYDSQF